ncbi:Sperm-associated antigen [Echinococcus granulosus]|uniref:Sperm-associated antigen n=1 Tax=Echinococcus granulosus TaxID=6210 RepID=W6UVN7_ECHGR|nr:Sperm-associated antigen [Echinococcus granulosus]EUB64711.1 Sperm-associated antigen [Echinococcus granulosus]
MFCDMMNSGRQVSTIKGPRLHLYFTKELFFDKAKGFPNYCSSVANTRRLLDFVYAPNDWSSVIENTLFAIHQGYNMYHETTSLYDIPLNHLDYQYITDCKKLKELEKILKVLRSGSEGRYPDLERHCEKKIQSIDPENKKQHNEKEWLNETKRQECLSNACGLYDINEDEEDETLPKVRLWGSINPDTGKGTRVKSLKTKSGKLRSYEEWDKIGKEIEKELEMDERDGEKSNEIAAVGAEKGEERKNNDNEKAVKSVYLKQKKWKLSVEDCNRVLEKEPENIKALLRRAQAFYELHSLVKAQKDLELVLVLEPKNSRATTILALSSNIPKKKTVSNYKEVAIQRLKSANKKAQVISISKVYKNSMIQR